MYADPPRAANEPGKVEENPVSAYLDAFDLDIGRVADLKRRYARRGVSNRELKERLAAVLDELLAPMRERRAAYERNMPQVRDALEHGARRARARCRDDGDAA
jgi:tryptophanyl-tRNA synthetase